MFLIWGAGVAPFFFEKQKKNILRIDCGNVHFLSIYQSFVDNSVKTTLK